MDAFQQLAQWFQPWALWLYQGARTLGLHPRVVSTYRSYDTQAQLYTGYVSGQRSTPAAPPGCSWHEYGLAFDLVSDNPQELGDYWKRAGGGWFANDPYHYQWTPGSACS